MTSSLEHLLAKDGFRGRRSGSRSRASFRTESMPLQDKQKTDRLKNGRTRSDISRYILREEFATSDSSSSTRRARDNLIRRENGNRRSRAENSGSLLHGSNGMQEERIRNLNSTEEINGSEIVELDVEEYEKVKDIHYDRTYNSERTEESLKVNQKGKEVKLDKKLQSGNSNKNLLKYAGSSDSIREKSMKQAGKSYESSVRGSKNKKNFKDDKKQKQHQNVTTASPNFAFDEVAVLAMVSILNGYIKWFFKDEEFRYMLHQNCLSCLNFSQHEEDEGVEKRIIDNLEQAIEVVEKAADEAASAKDLKKASVQLSLISGLNSDDLKDGYTSGIPNSSLSACAHLYLSVIYKLQKKDRISAKHLLQVFCDSPFLARTILLPELWDYLFFPHLSDLKIWYDQEADSLQKTPCKIRKLKLLDKVYNEIIDSSTYKFAVYYKDWLTEGIEAPSVPSIHVPSIPDMPSNVKDDSLALGSPSGPFSPRPMVSKKLFDDVFGYSNKLVDYGAPDDGDEVDHFGNDASSSSGSTTEIKQALIHSYEIVKYLDEDVERHSSYHGQDNVFLPEDHGLLSGSKEEWKLVKVSVSPETDLIDETRDINVWQETIGENHMPDETSCAKENEPIKAKASYNELHGNPIYFDHEGSFFASIPQDFICPLTGQLFEDPVTLETGQTFEREAIKKWFNEGSKKCPVTGKTLEHLFVPLTNFILKRVIDNWKSQHCSNLWAFASPTVMNTTNVEPRQKDQAAMSILEKILTTYSREERLANAKHLLSIGGLEFLIRRFESGDLEEKTCVAALFCCCIEADAVCRNQIARKIEKQHLLELLHSKQTKSRRNAMLLLIELVSLSRRKDVTLFLSGLQSEEIMNAMHVLLLYLQASPLEQKPLVAALLLHLDLQVEHRKYSIYREEAVDAIVVALEGSISDNKVLEKTCKALLILGGVFCSAGNSLTESWMLKRAGLNNNNEVSTCEENNLLVDDFVPLEEEEKANEEWLRKLSASLVGDGKRSFVETISKCLGSRKLYLVRVCLITIAWLSCALSDAEQQLSAFSAVIGGLKESLENGDGVEEKILSCISLLNFSKIPECRVLLMTIAEEIAVPLGNLAQITWTAKQLYGIISGEEH